MDLRSERDRASLTEQMSRLEKNIRGRDVKRQQGRERRKRANSDDDEEDDAEARMRREKRGREHGFLNLGAGALADAVVPAFTWHCELCQITLTSEGLKHQHLHGAAHLKAAAKKKAQDESGRRDTEKANAAMAMAAWTANAQTTEPVTSGRVREPVKRLDHHGNEIRAEGLRAYIPDSGLVHKGNEYKVIQNKMSAPLRRAAPPPKAAPKPILTSAPKPMLSNAPNLGGWAPPLPTGMQVQHDNIALPSRLLRVQLQAHSAPAAAAAAAAAPPSREATHAEATATSDGEGEGEEEGKEEQQEKDAAAVEEGADSDGGEGGGLLGGLLGTYASGSEDGDSDSGGGGEGPAAASTKDAWASDDSDDDAGDGVRSILDTL